MGLVIKSFSFHEDAWKRDEVQCLGLVKLGVYKKYSLIHFFILKYNCLLLSRRVCIWWGENILQDKALSYRVDSGN